jgi:hypothetical protein
MAALFHDREAMPRCFMIAKDRSVAHTRSFAIMK